MPRKALLLRVGIDRGTGGALGPIFCDGTFEYIPIPEHERTRDRRSYATLLGQHGVPLAAYLPRRLANVRPHVDPDFKTATYGDAAPRKCRQLNKLLPGDILMFYCGLALFPPIDVPRLFVIGYLYVKQVHCLTAQTWGQLWHRFRNTAHFLRCTPDRELTLVEGYPSRSRLVRKARPLGDSNDDLLHDLEALGYRGSVRRAVGHWVRGHGAIEFLEAWLKKGPTILAESYTRLFLVPPSAVRRTTMREGGANIAIEGDGPTPGDWILAVSGGEIARIVFFGRVSYCKFFNDRRCAFSCLFWHFAQNGPLAREVLPSLRSLSILKNNSLKHQAIIRMLISWFFGPCRIGFL